MRAKRHTLINALRAAAWTYENDALQADAEDKRIAYQFLAQASDAQQLANDIEQAERIILDD